MLLNGNQMTKRKHNVQKAMMHLDRARMYFGGNPSNPRSMERIDHNAIIQYSKQLGPRGGRPNPIIGPVVEPSKPSSFTFLVYASNEGEEDIFNDGNNTRSVIGNIIIEYHVTGGTGEHLIILTFRNASTTWEIDPDITNPPNEPVDRSVMYSSIQYIIDQASDCAKQHPQSTGRVDLYLKKLMY